MFPGNYVELVKEEEAKKEEPKKEEPKKEEKKATVPAASPAATSAPSGGFVCGPGEKKVKVRLLLFSFVCVLLITAPQILFHFEGSGEDELKVNEGDIVIIEEEVKVCNRICLRACADSHARTRAYLHTHASTHRTHRGGMLVGMRRASLACSQQTTLRTSRTELIK